MSIVRFKRDEKYIDFLNSKKVFNKTIGKGSNGYVCLGNDDQAYKIIFDYKNANINYKNIINQEEFNFKYFLFPEEVYVIDGKVCGYRTKYVDGDILSNYRFNDEKIDYEKLEDAYNRIFEEIDVLSKNGYVLYELHGNILFDQENLYVIDTCDYAKSDLSYGDLLNKNILMFNEALKMEVDNYNDYHKFTK